MYDVLKIAIMLYSKFVFGNRTSSISRLNLVSPFTATVSLTSLNIRTTFLKRLRSHHEKTRMPLWWSINYDHFLKKTIELRVVLIMKFNRNTLQDVLQNMLLCNKTRHMACQQNSMHFTEPFC